MSLLIPSLFLALFFSLVQASGETALFIKDINPNGDASPFFLTQVNGALYFFADDSKHGYELWKSDGTPAGTMMVKDINPNGDSIFFANAIPMSINDTLYFTADDGSHGYELWKTDGTVTGTVLVKDVNPGMAGSNAGQYVKLNDTLYFAAKDQEHGAELWKSNGTPTGTTLVTDLTPGAGWSLSTYSGLTAVNDNLFFIATDDGGSTYGLWVSDGTPTGNRPVFTQTLPTSVPLFSQFSSISETVFFGACFAGSCSYPEVDQLWKSDGTIEGTQLVEALGFTESATANNLLYLSADDGATGLELWRSDGTTAGTFLIRDINPSGNSRPSEFTAIDGTVYFSADDGQTGRELWKTDGTLSGTVRVKDINVGSEGSMPQSLTAINGLLYFIADDGNYGFELWKSDGTMAGTAMIQDINPGPASSSYFAPNKYPWLTNVNNRLFFNADNGTDGFELWAFATNKTFLPVIQKN